MRTIDAVRNVDELGRIVLPMSMRKALGIEPESRVDILGTEEGEIVLKPHKEQTVNDAYNDLYKKVREESELSADVKKSVLSMLKQIEKTLKA